MAHLFNNTDYCDYRSKAYNNIKKALQSKVDLLTDSTPISLHPMDIHEDIAIDGANFHFQYQHHSFTLPRQLLSADLSAILNINLISEQLDEQDIQQLLPFLPNQRKEDLQYALEGKGFSQTHLKSFERKLKSGYFTTFREKQEEIMDTLSDYRLRQIYQQLLRTMLSKKNERTKKERVTADEELSQVESLNDLSSVEELSENSQATETEEELDDFIDEEFAPRVFFHYDSSKVKCQEQLLALGEDKADKKAAMYKITLPMKPKNSQWVDNYRKQQFQRYSNPTKPWVYTCEDGRKVTVAPVAKKLSVLTGKPRDHPLLKSERPACVTILTLVRDAAARLPSGVGTRADISELLKESQYVNEDLPEQKLSNIVSGALDRLHYMTDACVKYDSEKKLWIYLHSDRNYEHPGWGEDGEDYLDKCPSKKKKREFE